VGSEADVIPNRYSVPLPADAPANAVAYQPRDKEYWVRCEQGHTHYGAHGAAGLLMRYTDENGVKVYYLQRRAAWVDHGGTYSIPGGAVHADEWPAVAAKREAIEELGSLPPLRPASIFVDDHGGWAYTTVLAVVTGPSRFTGDGGYEHLGGGWYTAGEMADLPLHPGFKESWNEVVSGSSDR
jgi:8-oxo-dGTP pyrophosphatase MutT (NUDIX family)